LPSSCPRTSHCQIYTPSLHDALPILLFHKGMYLGDTLHDFLAEVLDGQGVRTWGDLKLTDPGSAIPPERSYRLVSLRSPQVRTRSEEHTSELQSRFDLVCRLLLEKKK